MELSIIIPVYNTDFLVLEKCINSVLKIDAVDYEIILIDDGSEAEKSKEYQTIKNNKIRYVKQNNKGVSSARNYGISIAKGKYIMFVDSDDIIYAEALQKSYFNNEYDIVLFDRKFISQDNKKVIHSAELVAQKGVLDIIFIIKAYIENFAFHSPASKLYRRSFINKHSIQFDEKMIQGEDAIFNLDILEKNPIVYYAKKTIYGYNFDYETSSSRWDNKTEIMFNNIEYMYDRKEKIISKYKLEKNLSKSLYSMYTNNIFSLCVDKHNKTNIRSRCKILLKRRVKIQNIQILSMLKYIIINIDSSLIYNIIYHIRKGYLKYIKKKY